MSRRSALPVAAGVILAVSAFAGGLFLRQQIEPARPPPGEVITLAQMATLPAADIIAQSDDPAAPQRRPDFRFIDQDSRERRMSDWDGKPLVVNFWATWCPPCIEEIPAFIKAQTAYAPRNVQFVGIALDDVESVRAFAEEYGLNYPTAAGDQSAFDLMREFGNVVGGLPYTVVVDPGGNIASRHTGPVSRKQLDEMLAPVLERSSPA